VPTIEYLDVALKSVEDLDAALREADCTVIVTDHTLYDWEAIQRQTGLIIDTRHVLGHQGEK
jgi:UDP-N-acetyl-D-glucosamine dehydrogenase